MIYRVVIQLLLLTY